MKTGIFCSVKLYWKWKFLNILFFCWMLVSEKYEWWSNQIKRELAQTTSRNKKLSENDVQLAYYCIASVHRTSAFHLSTMMSHFSLVTVTTNGLCLFVARVGPGLQQDQLVWWYYIQTWEMKKMVKKTLYLTIFVRIFLF